MVSWPFYAALTNTVFDPNKQDIKVPSVHISGQVLPGAPLLEDLLIGWRPK